MLNSVLNMIVYVKENSHKKPIKQNAGVFFKYTIIGQVFCLLFVAMG